jgi:hypothetical protein
MHRKANGQDEDEDDEDDDQNMFTEKARGMKVFSVSSSGGSHD